jgi:hypothetical protein
VAEEWAVQARGTSQVIHSTMLGEAKGLGSGVAQLRAQTRYQEIAMLTHFLFTTLGAKPNRYQTTHPQGVEDRAHLVVGYLHPLLQEPLVNDGAFQRASRAFPLLADDLAYLLGQFSNAVSVISH